MIRSFKDFLPHILVVFVFIIISVAYFSPVLQGKEILQSDIVQYIGMSKQQKDFKAQTGEETYWTDAAFGGMPTYQLGANYPHNYIRKLDLALRFLPRPADYLFLYFLGFYILLLTLKLDWKLALVGSLAFGFSTYFIIILGVGHNAKAHAIAYMPMVIAGILMCFRRNYIWGFFLLCVAMALEINANHFQMTYYLLLTVIVIGIAYLIDAIKKKEIPHYFTALGVMIVAVILSLAMNATSLLATQEYTQLSTRGNTGLDINPDGSPKVSSGLEYEYITSYSYGILESFNLFIPRFMGGASVEKLDSKSAIYAHLQQRGASPAQAMDFVKHAPTYWGDQPYNGGPAYIGAVSWFLFFLALFLIRGRLKWWILGSSILALILSWGDNFSILTKFFIDVVPLYNKFRAITSIQVIIELCVPIFGIFGLYKILNEFDKDEFKYKALKYSLIVTGGLCLFLLVFKSMLFDFTGSNDALYSERMGAEFVRALKEDRKSIFASDTIRSLIFVLLSAGLIYGYLKTKISKNLVIAGFAVLILADLVLVDRRYVNDDNFVSSRQINQPFQPTQADINIMQDTTHYRVFDLSGDPFNTGRTSYFHNALGGYHAAKPGRISDLYDFYISRNNMQVLNMLNVKYFIIPNKNGTVEAQQNPETFGNAWFVNNIKFVPDANEEMLSLGETDLSKTAVVNSVFKPNLKNTTSFSGAGNIELQTFSPNKLVYNSNSDAEQFAVFSEIYYPHGWKISIDGKDTEMVETDYTLRGLLIPAGNHIITFSFDPQVVKTGSVVSLASSILLVLLFAGGIFYSFKKKN